jgi:hypothetical protein
VAKQVDPETIRSSAKDLEKAANRLDDEFDSFLNDLYGVGPAAGEAEMIGQVVGSGLDEAEVVLIEGIESVVDGIHWFAEALEVMAENYEDAETRNVQHVDDAWPGD